jgi:hypothetical protein
MVELPPMAMMVISFPIIYNGGYDLMVVGGDVRFMAANCYVFFELLWSTSEKKPFPCG